MSAIDVSALPSLPDGWHYEDGSAHGAQIAHIVWPEHGAVSVDFECRNIETGWCRPGRARRNAKSYAGRGWKTELVGDAINILRAAWA